MLTKTILLGLIATAAAVHADIDPKKLPPAAAKTDVTFDKDIKPIFQKSCFKCHGEEKQKGKLRVDSLAAIKKGSENGPIFEAGKSDKALLVHAISQLDPDTMMPPEDKGDPLTKEQVGLVRAWIDQGAK